MTTNPIQRTGTRARGSGDRPGWSARRAGAAGLVSAVAFAAAVLVAAQPDVATDAELRAYLDAGAWHQAAAWALSVVSGLVWLVFVVALRRLLPPGPGRDLFVVAASLGQVCGWVGSSLAAAAAPDGAHAIPLGVYVAVEESAHLAAAAGTAATGLALAGLGLVGPHSLWGTGLRRSTVATGVLLALTAVIGPLSLPLRVIWVVVVGTRLVMRQQPRRGSGAQA